MTDERFKELVKLATEQTAEVCEKLREAHSGNVFLNLFGALMATNDPCHRQDDVDEPFDN